MSELSLLFLLIAISIFGAVIVDTLGEIRMLKKTIRDMQLKHDDLCIKYFSTWEKHDGK